MPKRDFVVIEGGDAVGKETQARLLCSDIRAEYFGSPDDDTAVGKQIRRMLGGEVHCDPLMLQALYIMDRSLTTDKILHLLNVKKQDVVADRWWQSGVVYGTVFGGLDTDMLRRAQTCLPRGDLNILIDLDPKVAYDRQEGKQMDLYEADLAAQRRIREMYLEMWHMREDDPAWVVVGGDKSEGEVFRAVKRALEVSRWQRSQR